MRATDAAGNLSSYSIPASATTPAPDTQPPTVPTNLTATASAGQINLNWTASTDNVGVTVYRVERQNPGSSTFAQVGTTTGTTYSDTGLAANSTYSYQVRATDAAGNLSQYSNVATATTPSVTNESDNWRITHPEWIWCDDFESDQAGSYFEYDTAGGSMTRSAGVGIGGSTGIKVVFDTGTVSAGGFKLAFGQTPSTYFKPVDAGTSKYRELYWRLYLKDQAGWIGGGGDKLSRALVMANSNWAEAAFGHVWSGGDYLGLDPASGTDTAGNLLTTGYNDFAHMRWLGWAPSKTPIFDNAHVGQWHCIEAHMKLNDPGSSNGVFELWIDGKLEAQETSLNWLGSYNAYGINTLFIENYWNAGSPQRQERYIDNLVVSTQPIGPAAVPT